MHVFHFRHWWKMTLTWRKVLLLLLLLSFSFCKRMGSLTSSSVLTDKRKRKRNDDYKIADVMSKEVKDLAALFLLDNSCSGSFLHRLICAFQEIMSQAKKAKAAETVMAHFISMFLSVCGKAVKTFCRGMHQFSWISMNLQHNQLPLWS